MGNGTVVKGRLPDVVRGELGIQGTKDNASLEDYKRYARTMRLAPDKIDAVFHVCEALGIDRVDCVSGSVAAGVRDEKGDIDVVIFEPRPGMFKDAEGVNPVVSIDLVVFPNGQIAQVARGAGREGFISDAEEIRALSVREADNSTIPIVDLHVAEEMEGVKKVTIFCVYYDPGDMAASMKALWNTDPIAPKWQYQPFGAQILMGAQMLSAQSLMIIGALQEEFDFADLAFAYFVIAGQLMNVGTIFPELGIPANHELNIDFDTQMYCKGKPEDAAKTLFRAAGDLLMKSLAALSVAQPTNNMRITQQIDAINKLYGNGIELKEGIDMSVSLREQPDAEKVEWLQKYLINIYIRCYMDLGLQHSGIRKDVLATAEMMKSKVIQPKKFYPPEGFCTRNDAIAGGIDGMKSGKVPLIVAETRTGKSELVIDQMLKLAATDKSLGDALVITGKPPGSTEEIVRMAGERGIVVFDSLSLGSAEEAALLLESIGALREKGIAVVITSKPHHMGSEGFTRLMEGLGEEVLLLKPILVLSYEEERAVLAKTGVSRELKRKFMRRAEGHPAPYLYIEEHWEDVKSGKITAEGLMETAIGEMDRLGEKYASRTEREVLMDVELLASEVPIGEDRVGAVLESGLVLHRHGKLVVPKAFADAVEKRLSRTPRIEPDGGSSQVAEAGIA